MTRPTLTYTTRDGRTITVPVKLKPQKGYAAPPGSGPEGETCVTCNYFIRREFSKTYFKCDLVAWGGSENTDIRKSSLACIKWERKA